MSEEISQRRLVDETLKRFGSTSTSYNLSLSELASIVLDCTRKRFPSCADIFSTSGLSQEILVHSISCIAITSRHDIEMRHVNGTNLYFVCSTNPEPKTRNKTEGNPPITVPGPHCPFHLHFFTPDVVPRSSRAKSKPEKRWYYCESDGWNSLLISCLPKDWPEICAKVSFLQLYIRQWLETSGLSIDYVKNTVIIQVLKERKFGMNHQLSAQRAIQALRGKSQEKLLEADQKLEDYIHHLNKNGQYGAVLYSNGDLVVPAQGGSNMKHFTFEEHSSSCYSVIEPECYWDVLRDKECGTEQKQIFMTFQAVSSAFTAFRNSFPVVAVCQSSALDRNISNHREKVTYNVLWDRTERN